MKPIPLSKYTLLHVDNKYKYLMFPITTDKLNEIRQSFLLNEDFIIKIGSYNVNGGDIIIFGKSNETPAKIESTLGRLIKSHGGVLTIPAPIDKKNLLRGNKLVPGVSAYQVYDYKLCTLGDPDNVIIFKDLIPHKDRKNYE